MISFIFDTETTGLVKNSLVPLKMQPKIIEFFGHLVEDDGTVLEEIEFFCHPGGPLDPVITRITGITDDQLKGAKPFSYYTIDIHRMIVKADAAVAHNLSFDMALLEADFARDNGAVVNWPKRLICTVEQTEWMKGHRLSLGGLHEELFGEPFKGAHRARTDVNALTACYLELRKRGDI